MHPNTTNTIGLLLDYSGVVNDVALKEVLLKTANRFFLKDHESQPFRCRCHARVEATGVTAEADSK